MRFRRCANVIQCTYTNLYNIAFYTPRAIWYSLLLLGYKPVHHVTVLNTVGNCNTVVLYYIILYYIILYYNLMGPVVYAVRRRPKRRYAAHNCTDFNQQLANNADQQNLTGHSTGLSLNVN
jgi:hypothetical protein